MTAQAATSPAALDFSRPPESFLDLGHARLAYRRLGSGPDLLFLHGWPVTSATFREIAPALAERFTCHLIDLPGAGHSEWSADTPISIQGHAETVCRVVEALDLERYALVAHDSGAAIGRYAAARHPERVAAMVLGNTEIPGYTPPLLTRLLRILRLPGGKALFRLALRIDFVRRSSLGLGTCFADRSLLDGAFYEHTIAPILASKRAAEGQMALVDDFDPSDFDDLVEAHAAVKAPVQLIWGGRDPWFPLEKARAMLPQFAGGAELEVLETGKVFAHEEFPQDFVRHARPFLERAFGLA